MHKLTFNRGQKSIFTTLIVIIGFLFLAVLTSCSTQNMSASRFAKAQALYANQDYHSAFNKLLPLATSGRPDAQYALGYLYFYGQGTLENRKLAIYWFNQSAKQNYPDAMEALKQISLHTR